MSERKFRGKRIDTGEWAEGNLFTLGEPDNVCYIVVAYAKYQVHPETVGQHTGLKDKNGKKIWEGDICQYTNFFGETHDADGNDMKYVCEWLNASWTLQGIMLNNYLIEGCGSLEVIGNIHENPDLLSK